MNGTEPEGLPAGSDALPVPTQLRRGALRLPEVVMQGIGHSAPATAVLFTLPFIATHAGITAPLAYLIAFLIVLMLGVVLTQLARHLPSAGGYYTYVSRAVHPRAGFMTAWLFFLYTAMTPAFSLAMMGYVLESCLISEFGILFPWWLFLLVGAAFTLWVTYRGIELSAAALLVLGVLEMGIVVLLAAWGLFAPGRGDVHLSSFHIGNAATAKGFYLAVVFSIFALTGWEGVVPLAEESENPRKVVPRAIIGTIVIMGTYLVFTSWGLLIGWGTDDLSTFFAAGEMPHFVLARRFWGMGWLIVLFALINSMAAVSIASTLVSTRMWYAMARSGSLPGWLSILHPRFQTPRNAVLFQTAFTLIFGIGLGYWIGPDQEFFFMGTVLTLALSLIYTAGNLGVFLFFRRHCPDEFQPMLHFLFPVLSSVAVLWVAYKSIVPLPEPPLTYAPIVVGGWLIIGVAVLLVMKALGREQWLLKAGAFSHEAAGEQHAT